MDTDFTWAQVLWLDRSRLEDGLLVRKFLTLPKFLAAQHWKLLNFQNWFRDFLCTEVVFIKRKCAKTVDSESTPFKWYS